MAEVILMPRLSDTMTEGIIASWHKKIGDPVKKGELLAEIETDKATMELESYKDGFLLHLGINKGGKLQVNDLLAIVGEKEEDITSLLKEHSREKKGSNKEAENKKEDPKPEKRSVDSTATVEQVSSTQNGDDRTKASPLARMLAKEKGIDISTIQGTGDGGRIIKADIDSFAPSIQTTEKKTAFITQPAFSPIAGEEAYTDLPISQIRSIIARRLSESKFSAPHFYLTMEINMDNAIAIRTQLNEVSALKISFNDFVVKAAALALRQHPAVNASWIPASSDGGDSIRRYHHIHIGIAVAIEDGLIVPVIRFADQKPLQQIAVESKELSNRARNKKLQPNEFTGNTFTISNLGMMDIEEFTAIINPPDSCIMAVGKIKETVVKKTEGFGVTNVMKITLSCDHRSVDGATGASFLQTFKKLLENPVVMFL